jgi:hypothetical protein
MLMKGGLTMRSKLIPVIVIGGLFVLILGWEKTHSYLATGKRMAQKKVSEAIPIGFEIERAESMAEDLGEAILGYEERLVSVRVDADYLRDEIALKEKELEKDRVLLERISQLLEERQDSYLINGKRYSYDRVSEDALTRSRIYQSELEHFEAKKNNLKVLEETAGLLENQVRLAQSKEQEFGSTISKLRAKDAHLEAKKELAALSVGAGVKGFGKNHFVKIDGLLRELEKRQVKTERLLDSALGLRGQSGLIDYGS